MIASGLERNTPAAGDFDAYILSIGANRDLIGAGHLTGQWYSAFGACAFPRAWDAKEEDAARGKLSTDIERASLQRGAELAATLRRLEDHVKKVRALPFRRELRQ